MFKADLLWGQFHHDMMNYANHGQQVLNLADLLHSVTQNWPCSLTRKTMCNEGFNQEKHVDTSGQYSNEICSLVSDCIMGMKIEETRGENRERA